MNDFRELSEALRREFYTLEVIPTDSLGAVLKIRPDDGREFTYSEAGDVMNIVDFYVEHSIVRPTSSNRVLVVEVLY